jgi:hypothetical protein
MGKWESKRFRPSGASNGNGKGSLRRRSEDSDKFREGWDRIFGNAGEDEVDAIKPEDQEPDQ